MEEGGETSGSRDRRRRRHTPADRPMPLAVTTRSRSVQPAPAPAPLSHEGKRRAATGSRPRQSEPAMGSVGGKKRKRGSGAAADKSADDQDDAAKTGEEEPAASMPSEGGKRRKSVSEAAADKSAESARTGDEEPVASFSSHESSSLVSSPCRCPCLPLVVTGYNSDGTEVYDSNVDPSVFDAYLEEQERYCAKLELEQSLLTLSEDMPRTCLSNQELLLVRESATDAILQAAKSVVGLSSYIDGKPLAQSTGFFVDWDEKTKTGTILTSSHIICSKYPSIHDRLSTREYATDAQVTIHLSHNTSVNGRLLHYHRYYNIALFELSLKQSPQLLCFNDWVKFAQEVFLVGRNERMQLNIDYGRVQFIGPGLFENNHYMYVNCGINKCGSGGPSLDFDGKVVGMVDPAIRTAFIPNSILVRCLRMQKEFKCIPRLHLGLKFSCIKFLEASHIEEIIDRFSIDSGLIVKLVSEGSIAEKVGIKKGDIIKCLNGENISATIDLENLLLRTCEDHFKKGNGLGSNVDITFDIFNIRKERYVTKKLRVKVSDDVEVIEGGTYLVSAREGLSTLVSSSDLSQGRETPHEMVESGQVTPH